MIQSLAFIFPFLNKMPYIQQPALSIYVLIHLYVFSSQYISHSY